MLLLLSGDTSHPAQYLSDTHISTSEQLVDAFDLNDDDSIDFYEFCDMISQFHSQTNPKSEVTHALR